MNKKSIGILTKDWKLWLTLLVGIVVALFVTVTLNALHTANQVEASRDSAAITTAQRIDALEALDRSDNAVAATEGAFLNSRVAMLTAQLEALEAQITSLGVKPVVMPTQPFPTTTNSTTTTTTKPPPAPPVAAQKSSQSPTKTTSTSTTTTTRPCQLSTLGTCLIH